MVSVNSGRHCAFEWRRIPAEERLSFFLSLLSFPLYLRYVLSAFSSGEHAPELCRCRHRRYRHPHHHHLLAHGPCLDASPSYQLSQLDPLRIMHHGRRAVTGESGGGVVIFPGHRCRGETCGRGSPSRVACVHELFGAVIICAAGSSGSMVTRRRRPWSLSRQRKMTP